MKKSVAYIFVVPAKVHSKQTLEKLCSTEVEINLVEAIAVYRIHNPTSVQNFKYCEERKTCITTLNFS